MLAKLQKWGNSQGVRIPKQFLALAALRAGDSIELIAESDQIIIRRLQPALKKYTIQELFAAEPAGPEAAGEVAWGPAAGREEW